MIVAFDIETIPNPDAVALLPEPKASKRLKDPAKIEADIADKKANQSEEAALDPLTARVACYAMVGMVNPSHEGRQEHVQCIDAATDDAERAMLQSLMRVLGNDDIRIITWNGVGFDLPMIYLRAMVLGVDPGSFGAPPLNAWTKRYANERHYDLMQIWLGWSTRNKGKSWDSPNGALNLVACMMLGAGKIEFDVTTIPALIETAEGRAAVTEYCLHDTRLTWQLWQRMNGTMFA